MDPSRLLYTMWLDFLPGHDQNGGRFVLVLEMVTPRLLVQTHYLVEW